MINRRELKTNAKKLLKRNYGPALAVVLIISAFSAAIGFVTGIFSELLIMKNIIAWIERYAQLHPDLDSINSSQMILEMYRDNLGVFLAAYCIVFFISFVYSIFVIAPLEVGACRWAIKNRNNNTSVSEVMTYYKKDYLKIVVVMFMQVLFVTLWSMLFIIPGIIKAYEYRMVPYLIAENPDLTWKEALSESKRMMKGNKFDTFVLDLSFIGWHILGMFCCCFLLEFLYVIPYIYLTEAELYAKLKGYDAPTNINVVAKN